MWNELYKRGWVLLATLSIFFLLSSPADSKEKKEVYKSRKFSLSLGTWVRTGETNWNHDASKIGSNFGNPTSELAYEDLDSTVFEAEAEIELSRRRYLRAQFGFGLMNSGRLIDDDFVSAEGAGFYSSTQSGAHRSSRTFSDINDSNMWYLNLDWGYKLWVSKNERDFIRSFIGYQYWQEKAIDKGLEQIECTSFDPNALRRFCSSPGTVSNVGQKVITNEVQWDSIRIGLEGGHWFSKKLRLDANLVFVPYSNLLNQDIHHLRDSLQQDPSFEMSGAGIGYNLESSLKYQFTRRLFLSAGYKYWSIEVNDGTWKNFPTKVTQSVVNLNDFISYRHGATAQIQYAF